MPCIFTKIPFDWSRYDCGGEQWTHKCSFVGIKPHCACMSRAKCTCGVTEGVQQLVCFPRLISAVCFALWNLAPTKFRLNSPWALHLPAWRGCNHCICCWIVWIAISVWCNHCQLCQNCVHRIPPDGPNSSLVLHGYTMSHYLLF